MPSQSKQNCKAYYYRHQNHEQLVGIAREQEVPYSANIDNVIYIKTHTDSIANLKLNLNTDEYYKIEASKILSSVPTPPSPKPGENGNAGTPTPPPAPRVKSVRLSTRSTSKLSSAHDVDEYLNNLRSQLMRHIDNGEEIVVM